MRRFARKRFKKCLKKRRNARIKLLAAAKLAGLPANIPSGLTYEERHQLLMSIGFASYDMYLAISLWNKIRRRVYVFKGNKCKLCGVKSQVIHHDGYALETLLGLDMDRLVPLCKVCHEIVEFDICRKRTVVEAMEYLSLLRRIPRS